jgi:hypothetical protein
MELHCNAVMDEPQTYPFGKDAPPPRLEYEIWTLVDAREEEIDA